MCVDYGWCCTCGVGWKHGSMEENTLTWFYRSTPKHIPACRSEFTLWLHPVMLSLYCFYSRSTKYIDCLHGNVAQSCRYFFFLLTFQALWLVNMVHAGYIAGLSLVRVSLLSKDNINQTKMTWIRVKTWSGSQWKAGSNVKSFIEGRLMREKKITF